MSSLKATTPLRSRFYDDEKSKGVEHFSLMIPVRRLLLPLVERRAQENASLWPEKFPPGMVPLWRMWLRRSKRGELEPAAALEELNKAFDYAVPRNLALVTRLEEYFVLRDSQVHHMLSPELVQQSTARLRNLLVATYSETRMGLQAR